MFLAISVLLTGTSLCLFLWFVLQPATKQASAADHHTRHIMLNLVWPWVRAVRPLCEPFIPWRSRKRLDARLRLAALDAAWVPAELVALQALTFLVCTGMAALLLYAGWSLPWPQALLWGSLAGGLGAWLPGVTISGMGKQRQRQMLRELPFLLDMTTLCVEAGLNLHGALQRAAEYGPAGPLRQELRYTLAEIRAGTPRTDALRSLAERTGLPAMASLVSALRQADQTGSSLGPILRSQADQRRSEQFLRAEELAMKAPVKMLFPLVVFIFPCTFLIIGFPVAVNLIHGAW
ncbi:MAG TPA: type II secretion system F family protein [Burkholderiaceae bacterium]|nr:type II secretion system F family protein [Burkholderiaceae bacterium]